MKDDISSHPRRLSQTSFEDFLCRFAFPVTRVQSLRRPRSMSKQIGLLVFPSLLFAGMSIAGSASASAQDGTTPPPKVLIIQNEQIKPGQGGPHRKTEAAFIKAFADAKWPQYYTGMESMAGK